MVLNDILIMFSIRIWFCGKRKPSVFKCTL